MTEHAEEFNDHDPLISNCTEHTKEPVEGTNQDNVRFESNARQHLFATYRRLLRILLAINIAVLIASVTATFILIRGVPSQQRNQMSNTQLLGAAEVPVEDILYRFRTGVPDHAGIPDSTPFYGPPNATTDAAWDTILNAGLIKLTPQQARQLNGPTARNPHDPTSYVGVLEVFHELHCLNVIRNAVWASDQQWLEDETHHLSHCLEFLRQTLMCLGDVHISPIFWNQRKQGYAIHHDYTRQCRNFEKIHEWARGVEHFVNELQAGM